jgi:Trypsin-like peptidase domain
MSELHAPQAQQWLERLAGIRRRVCLVVHKTNRGIGTGFLVGPDLVLTVNFVVAQDLRTDASGGGGGGTPLEVEFDFEFVNGEPERGTRTAVREIVLGPDGDGTAFTCLTFAMLRLQSPMGDLPQKAGVVRGWFDLNNVRADFQPGEALFLLHYPAAKPLKLSEGRLIAADFPYRLRYEAETAGGSSGAPVFDRNFRLVGLHERRLNPHPHNSLEELGGEKLALRADSVAVALRVQGLLPPPCIDDKAPTDLE